MVTGWQKIDGDWYYFNGSGVKQTGWQRIGSTWYFFDEDGVMAADEWVGDYYFSAGGAMATGWQKIDGDWYYFNGSGVKQTGWQRISNTWYFFDEDGVMAADEWVGNYYFSAAHGISLTKTESWQRIPGSEVTIWELTESGSRAISRQSDSVSDTKFCYLIDYRQ